MNTIQQAKEKKGTWRDEAIDLISKLAPDMHNHTLKVEGDAKSIYIQPIDSPSIRKSICSQTVMNCCKCT